MSVVAKLCLVCKQYIPQANYIDHFKSCRKKQLVNLNVNTPKVKTQITQQLVDKDCGCGKQKK